MTYSKSLGIRSIAVACVILAFTLAASLGMAAATPGNAYAGSKTNVYVVTKIVYKSDQYKTTNTYTYKNGLVTKVTAKNVANGDASSSVSKYTYTSKKALKSKVNTYDGKTNYKSTYTTNSKGYVTKASTTYTGDSPKNVTKYSYKGGKLTKSANKYSTTSYTYYSNGNFKTSTYKASEGDDTFKTTYSYDKKGNLKKIVSGSPDASIKETTTFKNTYKNGRLAKQVLSFAGSFSETATFTYKKVSVPKSIAKMVKSQQNLLISTRLPFETAHN